MNEWEHLRFAEILFHKWGVPCRTLRGNGEAPPTLTEAEEKGRIRHLCDGEGGRYLTLTLPDGEEAFLVGPYLPSEELDALFLSVMETLESILWSPLPSTTGERTASKKSELVGRVTALIAKDLTADLSLRRISALLNVNGSYLSATFKKENGETLTEYVNRKRMEEAAAILSHSDRQIQSVAEECGVLDANYFIKLFKRQYGMTPTQFRKQRR